MYQPPLAVNAAAASAGGATLAYLLARYAEEATLALWAGEDLRVVEAALAGKRRLAARFADADDVLRRIARPYAHRSDFPA